MRPSVSEVPQGRTVTGLVIDRARPSQPEIVPGSFLFCQTTSIYYHLDFARNLVAASLGGSVLWSFMRWASFLSLRTLSPHPWALYLEAITSSRHNPSYVPGLGPLVKKARTWLIFSSYLIHSARLPASTLPTCTLEQGLAQGLLFYGPRAKNAFSFLKSCKKNVRENATKT